MRLTDFLRSDFVLLTLQGRDVDGVISEVAAAAQAAHLGDAAVIRQCLLEREALHPTVMGSGLAIPHATVPGLADTVVGVALSGGDPVPFGPDDQEPVRAFFVILSPPHHEREHVRLLARVCRLVRHEGFMDNLAAAPDVPAVLDLVGATDALHP